MRRLAILSVVLLASAASAQDKARDLLVGVWVADTTKDKEDVVPTVEFKKDGGLVIKVGPISVDGKYKFLSDDEIHVELELKGHQGQPDHHRREEQGGEVQAEAMKNEE